METLLQRLRENPLLRPAAGVAACALALTLGGCDTGKTKASQPPIVGTCEGSKAVKVKDRTSLSELMRKHTALSDGLYSERGATDYTQDIAISRTKAGKLTSKIGKFTVRDYSWFESAALPKPGTTIFVPRVCYDKANKPKK